VATTNEIQQAIDAWKEADRAAAAAEKLVADASSRYFQRLGPPPSDEMVGDARMLRSLAQERLERAMRLMNCAAANRPR
jgi:hypothetical protein